VSAVVVAIVSLVVFVAAAAVIAWPVVRGDQLPDESHTAADEQRQRVDDDLARTLASIKEIEFDHASGHLSDDDFSELDADERARAIELLRERDDLRPPGSEASSAPDAPEK
jgi:hypothetical protein